jgi:NAD(P)-dependent dehydrogenase (short-subunit alcohol dehydrogenase family)
MSAALQDKVAVVTGAGSGIGRSIAQRFAAEGATVYLVGRRQHTLDEVAAEIGTGAQVVVADTSQLADIDRLFRLVEEKSGRVDVLVANAGGGSLAALGQIAEQDFDATFATNVKGVLFTVQRALPLLSDGASVILTGSTASAKGGPAFSVYGATKAAVRNFARSWIIDLKGQGIRVNVLSPGPTKTPGLVGLVPEAQQQGLLDQLANSVPLGRVADPDEIANAALFLASDQSSFVNGIELFVDGGAAQA